MVEEKVGAEEDEDTEKDGIAEEEECAAGGVCITILPINPHSPTITTPCRLAEEEYLEEC